MNGFWQQVKEMIIHGQNCSRCLGMRLATLVLILAAWKLDPQAVKEIMLAGMSLATALVLHGAGSNARGKGPEIPPGGTSSTATMTTTDTAEVDPNATRS